VPTTRPAGVPLGAYRLTQVQTDRGLVEVVATSVAAEIKASDMLEVLRFSYGLIRREGR